MTDEVISEGLALCEKATPLDEDHIFFRYEHGGARLYRDRQLIADFYDGSNRELFYFAGKNLHAILTALRTERAARVEMEGKVRELSQRWSARCAAEGEMSAAEVDLMNEFVEDLEKIGGGHDAD